MNHGSCDTLPDGPDPSAGSPVGDEAQPLGEGRDLGPPPLGVGRAEADDEPLTPSRACASTAAGESPVDPQRVYSNAVGSRPASVASRRMTSIRVARSSLVSLPPGK